MPEDLSRKGHPGGAYIATAKTVWLFYRMSKLIYLPYVWGENNKAIWTAMSQAGECVLDVQRTLRLIIKSPIMVERARRHNSLERHRYASGLDI